MTLSDDVGKSFTIIAQFRTLTVNLRQCSDDAGDFAAIRGRQALHELSHPAVSSVIPGMRTRANVEFNCSIPGKGPLPEKLLSILRKHAWERNFYGV